MSRCHGSTWNAKELYYTWFISHKLGFIRWHLCVTWSKLVQLLWGVQSPPNNPPNSPSMTFCRLYIAWSPIQATLPVTLCHSFSMVQEIIYFDIIQGLTKNDKPLQCFGCVVWSPIQSMPHSPRPYVAHFQIHKRWYTLIHCNVWLWLKYAKPSTLLVFQTTPYPSVTL